MSDNPRDTCAVDKISVAVTPNLLDAVRAAAYQRRLSIADYTRGAVQARLTMDGVPFPPMPEKLAPMRVVELRADHPTHINAQTGERQWR